MITAKAFVSYVPCTEKKLKLQNFFAVSWKIDKELAKTQIINQLKTKKGIARGASFSGLDLRTKTLKFRT